MKRHIPNFITLLNLTSGFLAVIFASRNQIIISCWLIMAGMVFDFADGLSARLLKSYSDIGKDLDSLADIVTFGVAPGAIIFTLLTSLDLSLLPAIMLAGTIPAASALRLAKFNHDTEQSKSFKGMATPASAFTIVSFVIASEYSGYLVFDTLLSSVWFPGILSLLLSVLMLVKTRMFSFKFSHLGYRGNEERYVFIGISLLLLLIFRLASFPLIMISYIIISFFSSFVRRKSVTI